MLMVSALYYLLYAILYNDIGGGIINLDTEKMNYCDDASFLALVLLLGIKQTSLLFVAVWSVVKRYGDNVYTKHWEV